MCQHIGLYYKCNMSSHAVYNMAHHNQIKCIFIHKSYMILPECQLLVNALWVYTGLYAYMSAFVGFGRYGGQILGSGVCGR